MVSFDTFVNIAFFTGLEVFIQIDQIAFLIKNLCPLILSTLQAYLFRPSYIKSFTLSPDSYVDVPNSY